MASPVLKSPHNIPGKALGPGSRLILLGLSVLVLSLFVLSLAVQPDPRGYGTHEQFGLPPCGFRLMFQIPCPSCGGTTAVAHFVRGHWKEAASTHTGVFLMCLTGTAFLPWAWWSACRGRMWAVSSPIWTALGLLGALAAFTLVEWGIRLMVLS